MNNKFFKNSKPFIQIVAGLALALQMSSVHAAVAKLSVSGNKVLIGGQQGSLAGNSLFWSNTGWGGEKFYNAQAVAWLKNDWKSTVIRASMGVEDAGGYISDPSNKTRVTTVVDAAIANDMYAIIDWHTHKAELNQAQSIAFFKEMATKYGNTNNVIYEIYNEPLQISWSGVIKPYAQAVISAIRAIDPDNLIIVGTPTWSQDVDVAANDPIAGTNIAYTLHFYAGTHGQSLRDKAQVALNKGIALFVTEWGSVNADGGGSVANSETDAWVAFMKANKISNANWALNDKAEGASALVSGASANGGWVNSQLTASGAKSKDIIINWPSGTQPTSSTPNTSSSSSISTNNSLPFTLQAENYSTMTGVQTEATTDVGGGRNVGWTDANDSLSYSGTGINIPATGSYKITYRVASLNGGGSFTLREVGGSNYDNVSVPSTGGWQTWVDVSRTITLSAGVHKFGLLINTGGFNINWFKIEAAGNSSSTPPRSSSSSSRSSTSGSASCRQIVSNDWGSGYGATIRITNNRTTAINGWNIGWTYSDGTRISGAYNATVTGSNPYSATNLSWNSTIQPGQYVEFGFQATKGGSTVNVPVFTGAACN
ncbi:MAG: cellulase family glycosylhydrolase [Pseudomonadota bacterium]